MSIKMNEIRENWSLIKKQVETAEKEIKNNEIGNTIYYFTWLAAENLTLSAGSLHAKAWR